MRFLQPCLLVLLHRQEAYGYRLLGDLGDFGFDQEHFDPSLVYRALREMEDTGLIESTWDQESQGPQRRVYRITDAGDRSLIEWIEELEQTREEIDRLIRVYRNRDSK